MGSRRDTDMGGRGSAFVTTRHSAVLGLSSADAATRQRSWTVIVEAYWKPVYKYLRVRRGKSDADAKDLTQGFLALAMEKDFFTTFDPSRARFRTFLRTCLDRYVANRAQAEARLKRGGGQVLLSLDFSAAEGELARAAPSVGDGLEQYFEMEWARSVLAASVDRLRDDCRELGKDRQFALFERYDLGSLAGDRPTYAALASEFSIKVSDVTNHLAWARRRLREHALHRLREMTASEEEFRAEARALLGLGKL